MLATFAFDVCHEVYRAAREAIDSKIPTLNVEASGQYQWRPDRLPRLGEYVCDFARAGERALGGEGSRGSRRSHFVAPAFRPILGEDRLGDGKPEDYTRHLARVDGRRQAEACPTGGRSSRLTLFHVFYLGGAEYSAARRHLGISEVTWADWAEEIRRLAGRELTRAGLFPPSRYFREASAARAS
jgi:hypothetical protein